MKRSRGENPSDDEGRADSVVDDGSGGEDDDGRIPGYDACKESLPESEVFSQEFKDIVTRVQEIIELLVDPIKSASARNAVVEGLLQEIQRRTRGDYPEEVRIALVGTMKSGKSSVINSLLSKGVIARQGDPGRSCTWVVNEFRHSLPGQTKTFAADVYFFTQDERQEIIKSMVSAYYRASAKYLNECEEAMDQSQGVEDFNTQKDVVTACMALFKDRNEFQTPSKAHKFLSAAESEDDEAIVDKLVSWVEDRMALVLGGSASVRLEAEAPGNLLSKLGPYQYTVNTHYGEISCSMWPMVNHIKFGLESELLQHNLSLVDLPGLTDANKIRVQNAIEHLNACTHEMVVADIARAEDDNFIRERLKDSHKLRDSGRTILVLTHGDDMDENTDFTGSPKEEQALKKLIKEAEQLERKINEMSSRIQKGGPDKQKWKAARKEAQIDLDDKEAAETRLRLAIRSKDTKEEMTELYADITQDPVPLSVFCVGNKAYRKHQAGYKSSKAAPILSVEETQIPALRQHLFMAPAEGKLTEARNLVFTQLPVAIKCATLFVTKTHLARKDDIKRMIQAPQAMVDPIVDQAFEWLKDQAEETLLVPYRNCDQEWSRQARKLCHGWAKVHGPTVHLTFLKKDGVKKGRGRGAAVISWNNELIDIKSESIQEWFGIWLACLYDVNKRLFKTVMSHIHKIMSDIKADPQYTLMALQSFVDFIYEEKQSMRPCVDKAIKRLRKDLSNVYGSATSEEPNNQIVRAMAPVYDYAQQIKGRPHGGQKAPQNRVNFFNKEVCKQGDGVWMRSHDYLKRDLHKMLDKHAQQLKMDIKAFFVDIDAKFEMMSADKSKETPEEAQVREALGKSVIQAEEKYSELLPVAEAFFGEQKASLFVEQ